MNKKSPNKFFAPIVIAGLTVGFFVSAYKFVFGNSAEEHRNTTVEEPIENENKEIKEE